MILNLIDDLDSFKSTLSESVSLTKDQVVLP